MRSRRESTWQSTMRGYRYFIDTNIFLRALVREEQKTFTECVSVLNVIRQKRLLACTSNLVLAEVVWTFERYYLFSKEEAIRALLSILHTKNLAIWDAFDPLSASQFYRDKGVKFVDALIASHALFQRANTFVVSYDHDFDKLGIPRKEPGEIIKK